MERGAAAPPAAPAGVAHGPQVGPAACLPYCGGLCVVCPGCLQLIGRGFNSSPL